MLLVIAPYAALHTELDTMGMVTSCSVVETEPEQENKQVICILLIIDWLFFFLNSSATRTAATGGSKAGDPAVQASREDAGRCGQTNRTDVVVEGHSGGQLQQGQVVVVRFAAVARMNDDLRRRELLLVGI